jgi:hypothetical protein
VQHVSLTLTQEIKSVIDTVLEGIIIRYLEALESLSDNNMRTLQVRKEEYLEAREGLYQSVGMEFPK